MLSRSRVDVRLASSTMSQLTPSPRSLIDGSDSRSIADTCCLRRVGLSRLRVALAVDQATANRFARTCALEARWWRRIVPAVLVLVALLVIAAVVDGALFDSRFLKWLLLANLAILVAVTAGGALRTMLRSRHHPTLMANGEVVIRDVDRAAAELWAELNPAGMIGITVRGARG
jgi:hypothetical protein